MKSIKTAQATLGRLGLAVLFTALMQAEVNAAKFADFLFIVDESGSMSAGHDWLDEMIFQLDEKLQQRGLGTSHEQNHYGLVGYGNRQIHPRSFDLDPDTIGQQLFGSAEQFARASLALERSGGIEDGYDAIDFGLDNYEFRPRAAVNLVLVTDEDRDIFDSTLSFESTLDVLNASNALLNVVVSHRFPPEAGKTVVGVDGQGNAFTTETDLVTQGEDDISQPMSQGNVDSGATSELNRPIDTTTQSGSLLARKPLLPTPFPPVIGLPVPPPPVIPSPVPRPPITPRPVVPPLPGSHGTTQQDYVDLAWSTQVQKATGAAWDFNLLRRGGTSVETFTDVFTEVKADEAYAQTVPEAQSIWGLVVLGISVLATRCWRRSPFSTP